eukprot:5341295-Prymnesium_polylepis.1
MSSVMVKPVQPGFWSAVPGHRAQHSEDRSPYPLPREVTSLVERSWPLAPALHIGLAGGGWGGVDGGGR